MIIKHVYHVQVITIEAMISPSHTGYLLHNNAPALREHGCPYIFDSNETHRQTRFTFPRLYFLF